MNTSYEKEINCLASDLVGKYKELVLRNKKIMVGFTCWQFATKTKTGKRIKLERFSDQHGLLVLYLKPDKTVTVLVD